MSDEFADRETIAAELRASEDRIRIAQSAGGICIFRWNLTSKELEWTPQIAELLELDRGEAAPFPEWNRFVFFDDLPKLRAALDTAAETGGYYVEFRVTRPGRGIRWIAGRGETVRDETGRPQWVSGVFYEITERKGLEARLLALNEMLEARFVEVREEARTLEILNRTGIALAAELSLERLVQTVTDAAVELTGAQFGAFFYNVIGEAGEAYTLYTLSGVPREAFENFPMPRNTAVFGPTFRGEGPVRSDDILLDARYGQSAPYHGMPLGHLPVRSYLALPVVSRAGEVIGGLFFGHAEPGIFTERTEKIVTGIAAQAAIAMDNARLYEARQQEIDARKQAEQQLQHLNETLEARVLAEVDRRQEAEDALRQAQKMEAIGQLTGGIAHDFNNMLTVVMGNIETLDRNLPVDDRKLHRLAEAAMRGAERAAMLTHRLLAFSRRQPLDPRPIEINRLIAGMSDLLHRTLGERIRIETVLSGGLWRVSADPNQLENAVLNLAVNARDAMLSGGVLTIETYNGALDDDYAIHEKIAPGEYVVLAVSDTGTGMSQEIISKAFEPFFTTKGFGEGTGLGLSQVYGFIKQSGGHVKIYSEIGEGTTVRLYLPRVMSTEKSRENARRPAALPSARGDETILLVEDDEDVRNFSSEILRELGYSVLEARDGEAALGLLGTEPDIKLLFTDVGLPGSFNGRQLADEARRRHPAIKVLFTTGYARNAITHQGRLDAGVELIVKPFTFAALAAKVRGVLDGA
jgi:signal transduction histidine kinase